MAILISILFVLGDLAYNEFVQNILFQANYFRDPSKTDSKAYKKYSQLAQWENEGDDVQVSRNENFAKTGKFVWVLATEDTVVWPREGEQFGAMDPADPFKTLLSMNETAWYQSDSFGLRTADEAGKNNFESFEGNHIAFTEEELMGWLEKYFMD
jgi:palmitoyl-protein thioesterase